MIHKLIRPVTYCVLLLVALLIVSPILFMVVGSFKPDALVFAEAGTWKAFFPETWTFQNYSDVFARVDFARFMLNSLLITGTVVGGGLVVNAFAAYALARLRWRGRETVLGAVMVLLIIPFEAIAVPLFFGASSLGWRDTFSVQIIPFIANPFSIYLFYTYFLGIPEELEEAARVDGAGLLRIFIEIIIPNARPAFASVAILTFLVQWGFFLWPLLVTTDEMVRPLPVAIAAFYTLPPLQWGDILAFAVMMVSPILLVFLIFQRWFIRSVASSAIKG